jgi:prophage maintenance system killer protein
VPDPTSTTTLTLTPDPTPIAKSKALSIALQYVSTDSRRDNSWTFFETSVGVQADICSAEPLLDDEKTRWPAGDDSALESPPWPWGTFSFTKQLWGEDGCYYLNDGQGAGDLHCPSFGEGKVNCHEDSDKGNDMIVQCVYASEVDRAAITVAYCEW